MKNKKKAIALTLLCWAFLCAGSPGNRVPGVVVNHIPASQKVYIGSPSLAVLPNGSYVASHDHFGPATTEHERAVTNVYRSTDKGKNWQKIAVVNGQFWSNLFVHRGQLYLMGTWRHHGNFIIRRSTDGGVTWSDPSDGESGLLLEGEYHTAPMPVTEHNGRLWRAMENAKSNTTAWGKRYSAMVMSAPVDADLLKASNWKASNALPYDSTYLEGNFRGWLEGNAVVTPEGKMVDMLRVATAEKGSDLAALVQISDDGSTAAFDPATGFIPFDGGARKFTIRYDAKSKRYWTISNYIKEEFRGKDAGSVRNTLVLKSSPDLINWTIHKVLLEHPDATRHGFQYVDWQFKGPDILFLSRTAYDDEEGGARNFHDANYLTFHVIKRFRSTLSKSLTP